MMTFTIAIPVRNGAQFLEQAIKSAVEQSRAADEILVVDDASTDCTASIAQDARWAGRVRYVYNERPTGWADAFNRAARMSEGDWIVLLSADDLLDRDCLLHIEKGLQQFPAAAHCYVGYRYIDKDGRETKASPGPHSLIPKLLPGRDYAYSYLESSANGAAIHRFLGGATKRDLWVNACPVRKEAGLIGDNDFFLRIGALTDVVAIDYPLASVRYHFGSVTASLESLNHRLAEDYVFQVREHATEKHLSPEVARLMIALASRHVDGLLIESFRRLRPEYLARASELREEITRLTGGESQGSRDIVAHVISGSLAADRTGLIRGTLRGLAKLKTIIAMRQRVASPAN